MSDERSGDLVIYALELEGRDADVAAQIEVARALLQQVDDVRARAGQVRAAITALPRGIEQADEAERSARAREAEAQRELGEAERQLADVGRSRRAGKDETAAAERVVRRAAVAAADAAATSLWLQERAQALRSEQIALRAEAEGLAVEALDLAGHVAVLPRLSSSGQAVPGRSLEEIEDWGARAHAALFVVRGGLETERERIVTEANVLAAAALGEQLSGTSVALVRKRLEQSLLDA